MVIPASFSFIFGLFHTLIFLNKLMRKMSIKSSRTCNLQYTNLPPITTGPQLPRHSKLVLPSSYLFVFKYTTSGLFLLFQTFQTADHNKEKIKPRNEHFHCQSFEQRAEVVAQLAEVVAQLAERLLPIPEVCCLNLVIGKNLY